LSNVDLFSNLKADGVPQPLKAGGCTIHAGRTLHYAGPNLTDEPRRAYIVNYRPMAMIEFERDHDYDHGKRVRSTDRTSKCLV
jgi:hypothetical protein